MMSWTVSPHTMRSEAECVIRNHLGPAFTETVNLAPHFLSENELLASIWQCQIVACQYTLDTSDLHFISFPPCF